MARLYLNECLNGTLNPELKGMCFNNLGVLSWFEYRHVVSNNQTVDPDFDSVVDSFGKTVTFFNNSIAWLEVCLKRV